MTRQQLQEFVHGISLLIYPNFCLICDTPEVDGSEFRHGLCNNCYREIASDPHAVCPKCAATVGVHVDAGDGCGACRTAKFAFDAAVRVGPYAGRLTEGILRTKTGSGEALAEMLGRVLAEIRGTTLCTLGIDVVVPVPLFWRRRWTRGYNQAAAIARELAFALELPLDVRWLRRVKPAVQHLQSSASARRENIQGAFAAQRVTSTCRKRILLVDDVMTTGSTLSEAARTLKAAGAESVVAAVLARR